MSQFLMPSLGADMESAVLMEWHVKEGDAVKKGQIIAEVETSKGVIEIEVFEDGIVKKLLVAPETDCKVGMPLAIIASADDTMAQTEKTKQKSITKEQNLAQEERIKISPAARKRAVELGVDLNQITPIEGVIQLSQIEAVAPTKEKSADKEKFKDGMRQAIAAAMSRSNAEIPHYYLATSINMTPALEYLKELNRERNINERILPVALLVRAVVLSLKEVPQLNGFWQDSEMQLSKEIHPGIAIALRGGGLITPALVDAQEMSLDDTMHSLSELITRTRTGKLRSSEMTQQTITITNLGDLGVESVYGVIYPPQLAIVGFGAIMNKPWAEKDALCVRKVMSATLAGDHRATDGRIGALFLDKLNRYLQKPEELL
ncbi:MAG: dihydrolipoamide acetyltransferase family protein [Campylobacterales bacterium]|nr:dihydrolipoamide acetyltransferase family protein [Campylobacterales bacterium]